MQLPPRRAGRLRGGPRTGALPALLAADDPRLLRDEALEGGPPVWLLTPATRRTEAFLRGIANRLVASLRAAPGVWRN